MRVLENLVPDKVFYYFEEISSIPRGSGDLEAVSDYCVNFAKERNLAVRKDELNNVVIKKPATEGREYDTTVIIQGHLDMVCEKTNESNHDFENDGIELLVDGDWISANGTTLGADNGIAIAYALAILDDNTISHPALEVIFTADEEIGMFGAKALDMSDLTGKYMLNLDCEEDGICYAGCAGGARLEAQFDIERTSSKGTLYTITVKGLKGGHSGAEIDKERANASMIMGRVLHKIDDTMNFGIVSVNGGSKDNVITRENIAQIVAEDEDTLKKIIDDFNTEIKNEYAVADQNIIVTIEKGKYGEYNVVCKDNQDDVITFIYTVPYGPQNYCTDVKGVVETSLNMGVVNTTEDKIVIVMSVRSMIRSRKELLLDRVKCLALKLNAKVEIGADYPEWEFKRNSALQDIMKKTYFDMYKEEIKMNVIHAGLECGYFLEKNPELDVLSFGPQMFDIHTPEERLSISSTKKVYDLVLELLKNIK